MITRPLVFSLYRDVCQYCRIAGLPYLFSLCRYAVLPSVISFVLPLVIPAFVFCYLVFSFVISYFGSSLVRYFVRYVVMLVCIHVLQSLCRFLSIRVLR